MCTQEELQEIKDEIMVDVVTQVDASIGKWTKKNIIGVVVLIVTTVLAWGQLTFQVQHNTDQLNKGDRFTAADGLVLKTEIDALKQRQDSFESWLVRIEAKLDLALRQ